MQKQNVLQQGYKQKAPCTLCFPAKEGNAVNPVHSKGTGNNSIGQSHTQAPPDPHPKVLSLTKHHFSLSTTNTDAAFKGENTSLSHREILAN